MRLHGRKGDIFFFPDIFAWLILIGAAILFFGLFWLSATAFQSKLSDQQHAEEGFAVTQGGTALRTYLATRMDEPIGKYLPPNVTGAAPADFTQDEANMTFGEALPIIMSDSTCRQAISQHGRSYDGIAALRDGMTPGTCRTFLLRTILFYRMFTADTFVLQASRGSDTIRIGHGIRDAYKNDLLTPSEYTAYVEEPILTGGTITEKVATLTPEHLWDNTVILLGSQAVPGASAGDAPITVTLLGAEATQ